MRTSDIVEQVGTTASVVKKVLKRFDDVGGQEARDHAEYERIHKKQNFLKYVKELVDRKDKLVNVTTIKLSLQRVRNLRASKFKIHQALKTLGYRWKRTRSI